MYHSVICRYTKYGLDKIGSVEHHQLALKAAREGIVLLKNENHALPQSFEGKKLVWLLWLILVLL